MKEAIDDFLSYLVADRGYSPRTVKTYHDSLVNILAFLNRLDEEITWQTLDSDAVRQWMTAEMGRGTNPRTVSKELSALRSFYKYLLRMERVQKDPVRLVKAPKKQMPLPTFLKQSEIDRLFDDVTFLPDYQGQRDRTILFTFYHTGIRVSEMAGLQMGDVHLSADELKVTGKRNKQRIIPFGAELHQQFQCFMQLRREVESADDHLFLTAKGKPLSIQSIRIIVKKYLSLVTNLKKKSPHVLRHTFATAMLNNGADLEAIKELLGHESISTTEVYTHTTFADLKKEYERAHPRA